jgi:hypothetical protein
MIMRNFIYCITETIYRESSEDEKKRGFSLDVIYQLVALNSFVHTCIREISEDKVDLQHVKKCTI